MKPNCVLPSLLAAALPAQEPHAFLPNQGQWPTHVRAGVRHGAQTTWLTDGGWTTQIIVTDARRAPAGADGPEHVLPQARTAIVEVELVGGTAAKDKLAAPLPGSVNFLLGNDPRQWATAVPRMSAATRKDAWPGVDLQFSSREGDLAYDLIFAAGVDAGSARFRVRGAENARIADDGSLVLDVGFGELRHGAPVAWQVRRDGTRQLLTARFDVLADGAIAFVAIGRDERLPLVIDPPLQWSSLLGGAALDQIGFRQTIDRDASGQIVVCGVTGSWNFPATNGSALRGTWDGFVTALAGNGVLQWSALIGGTNGDEYFRACRWDGQGGVFFAGYSAATDFPVSGNALQPTCSGPFGVNYGDMVIGRFVPGGSPSLPWSTYLGGVGQELVNGLTVLPGARVAVTGWSNSTTLPTPGTPVQLMNRGGYDGYVAILDPAQAGGAQCIAATWWGGSLDEVPGCIVRDASGRLVVGGYTSSLDLVTTANALQGGNQGGLDGYLVRFDATLGAVDYCTYLGGPGADQANDLAFDSGGRIVVANWTAGFSFAMPPGAFQLQPGSTVDGFALALDPALPPAQQLVWGTYLGGLQQDGVNGLAVDSADRITVVGSVEGSAFATTAFPSTSWPLQGFVGGPGGTNGHWDAFVARLDPRRQGQDQLVYGTFLGGTGYDYAYDVLLDERARALVVGPTASAAFHGRTNNGGQDVFVVHVDLLATVADRLGAASPVCSLVSLDAYHQQVAGGFDLTLTASSAPPNSIGFLLLGLPDPTGTAVPPFGLVAHLLLSQPVATLAVVSSDSLGFASFRIAVNLVPPLGLGVQAVWVGNCATFLASDMIRL